MAKRTAVLLQLALLGVALLYGGLSTWPYFFPEAGATADRPMTQGLVVSLAQARPGSAVQAPEVFYIWGQESPRQDEPQETLADQGRQWQVSLDAEGWVLSRQHESGVRERWLFSGVVRIGEHNTAVFYDLQAEQGWRLVRRHGHFDALLVTFIAPEKIHLQDPEGREWVLGLFHLKEVNSL